MEQTKQVLNVSDVNEYIRMLMDGDRVLGNVLVRGEISNFKCYQSSGHLYFTLKDEEGQLKSVMFRSYASRLAFRAEDGMKVIAHGRISVYSQSGQYQLYVDDLQPDGAGALALRFEQLKRKLEAEGLFDASRKKPLPRYPRRIGVITSPSGAAVHDVKNVLGRRFPAAEMILFPSAVQGAEAPEQLRAGVAFFGESGMCDVIIIGRGGGSAEDLWAFNDEALAREIAACPIPVISAVGHESDFTICDFVADRRAPTPSAAAELAVPDASELIAAIRIRSERMERFAETKILQEKRYLQQLASSPVLQKPQKIFDLFRMRVAEKDDALNRAVASALEQNKGLLAQRAATLEAMSPLSVLSRGYAAVSRGEEAITRAKEVSVGDRLKIRFSDGEVDAVAESMKGERERAEEKTEL